jgi:hypothetical protein
MIPVIREAPLIGELLEIPHDGLLLYENAEKPLLPSFNRLILQEVCVASCVGAVDTPSAWAYAASIRENEADLPKSGGGRIFIAPATGLHSCACGKSALYMTVTTWLENVALARSSGTCAKSSKNGRLTSPRSLPPGCR